MLDYIRPFLNLCYYIIKTSQKLKDIDIHLIYVILLSFPCLTVQDVIRQNLLDKEKNLTLNMMITKLITITNQNEQNCQVKKIEKKVKAEQLALLVKSSDIKGSNRENKKNLKKGKRKSKPTDEYYTCHQKRLWSNNCLNVLNKRKILRKSCYNLKLRDKSKEEPCIEFTQENLIEYLV